MDMIYIQIFVISTKSISWVDIYRRNRDILRLLFLILILLVLFFIFLGFLEVLKILKY